MHHTKVNKENCNSKAKFLQQLFLLIDLKCDVVFDNLFLYSYQAPAFSIQYTMESQKHVDYLIIML